MCGECVAGVVVTVCVRVAEREHVIRIIFCIRIPIARRLKQWDRFVRLSKAEECEAAHLHRLFIVRISLNRRAKSDVGFSETVLCV